MGTCGNIKSKQTSKRVQGALRQLLAYLRNHGRELSERVGATGIVLCAAADLDVDTLNSEQRAGGVWAIQPEIPLRSFLYRCDRRFWLDELEKNFIVETETPWALVLVSGRRCEFYHVTRMEMKRLAAFDEALPNAQKKGGQSAQRFGRIRDEVVARYVRKIAETCVSLYTRDGVPGVEHIIVAGPAELKDDVTRHALFPRGMRVHPLVTAQVYDASTAHSILPDVRALMDREDGRASERALVELESAMTNDPDRLVFGVDAVRLEATDLATVYATSDVLRALPPTKARLVAISDEQSRRLGGITAFGERYVAVQLD